MVRVLNSRAVKFIVCLAIISSLGGGSASAAEQDFKNPSPLPVKNSKSTLPSKAGTKLSGRGGYSYSEQDVINTYGDARGRYGAAISLRDPQMDRQTNGGPFDQGFFFDSAIAPRGGEAPYMN